MRFVTAAHQRLVSTGCVRLPHIAQRVRVPGSDISYFVVSIDQEQQLVTLLPTTGQGPVLEDVPYSDLDRTGPLRPENA